MAVIKMSVSKWVDVLDNPRQRNTVKRAKYATNKHLKTDHSVQRYVFAASNNGEILCKLDGHTRAYLWESGRLKEPVDGKVEVCLVECKTLKEAGKIYSMLDSPRAVERPSDAIYGFARENKFELSSALLRGCQFSNQLRQLDAFAKGNHGNSNDDIGILVKRWKKELIELDSLSLSSNYSTLIAFMLLSIHCDGLETASKFIKALDANEGTKNSRGMDGVEALAQHFLVRRAEGRLAGYDNLYDLMDRAWTAYAAWKNDKRMKLLRATNVSALMADRKSKLTGKDQSCQS